MDWPEKLNVRFHYNGEFLHDGKKMHYCGGTVAMSYIDHDKVSLPELIGHLKDHCTVLDGTMLHWLIPGRELHNGLRALVDDKACLDMLRCTEDGFFAEVYVEAPVAQEISDDEAGTGSEDKKSDYEDEMDTEFEDEAGMEDEEEALPRDANLGSGARHIVPYNPQSGVIVHNQIKTGPAGNACPGHGGAANPGDEISSTDSEFLAGDDSSSEEDEEAKEILRRFKEFKKKLSSGQTAQLDDIFVGGTSTQTGDCAVIDDEGYSTPYANSSDEDESFEDLGSDADGLVGKESKYPRFSKKDAVPKFSLGMKFSGKRQFKKAIIKYALAERKVIKFIKDDIDRVRAKCDWPTCPWVCLLSINSTTTSWQISSYKSEHSCPPRRDNKMVTGRRIAERYEKMIRANPTWSLEAMKVTVQEEMFADVSIAKLKRAKKIVLQKMLDATKGQYQRLFDYQLELLRSNPGSTVIVKVQERMPVFERMYICLDACRKGFLAGCRKVVGLDGCFFKGATNGELLCAVGRDANNQMYPIAWAVVEKENNDTWDWFCDILFRDLSVGTGEDWVFTSDQQKGILNAVQHWAPLAEHRNCARHLYANWRKKFKKKEWQKRWWKCAKASCPLLFNMARSRLAQFTREGAQALMNTNPCHWSRAWFKLGTFCDSVDNNLCESFNKWIVEARFYPIITMLEMIRRKVMVRIQENSTKVERWTTMICPNILKKLNVYITQSGFCHAISNGNDKYEVVHYDHRWTVDLTARTCSCRYWQLAGLPCPHAISCIYFTTHCLEDYIAPCFSVSEFKKTYSHYLQPVEGMHSWPISEREKPLAPPYVKMPGRPKKERKRESTEKPKPNRISRVGTVIRCTRCKGVGHNRTSCAKRNGMSTPVGPSKSAPVRMSTPVDPSKSATVRMSSGQLSCSSARVVGNSRKRSSHLTTSIETCQPQKKRRESIGINQGSLTRTSAVAKVSTDKGGSATLNLKAQLPLSQASSSVTVHISSGSASAKVNAQEPSKRKKKPPVKFQQYLMLPPTAGAASSSGSGKKI